MSFLWNRSSSSSSNRSGSGTGLFNRFRSNAPAAGRGTRQSKRVAIDDVEEEFDEDECSPAQRQKELDDLWIANNALTVKNAELVKDNLALNKTLQEERDIGISFDVAIDVVVSKVLAEARSKETLIPLNAAKIYTPAATATHRDRIWLQRVPPAISKLFTRLFPVTPYKPLPMDIDEDDNIDIDSNASDTSVEEFIEYQSHNQAAAMIAKQQKLFSLQFFYLFHHSWYANEPILQWHLDRADWQRNQRQTSNELKETWFFSFLLICKEKRIFFMHNSFLWVFPPTIIIFFVTLVIILNYPTIEWLIKLRPPFYCVLLHLLHQAT